MNLRSFSFRHYGLLVGAALLLFMVPSVWWTAPPEEDYSRKEFRSDETRDNQPAVGDVATTPAASEAAEVQYRRGQQYLRGEGISQNAQEAAKLFRIAAEQGYTGAQYDLAVLYGNGQGVTQDYVEAMRWLRKAAEQE